MLDAVKTWSCFKELIRSKWSKLVNTWIKYLICSKWIKNQFCCWLCRWDRARSWSHFCHLRSSSWSIQAEDPSILEKWKSSSQFSQASNVRINETRSDNPGKSCPPVPLTPPSISWCRKNLATSIRSGGSGNPSAPSGGFDFCLTTTRTPRSGRWWWSPQTPDLLRVTKGSDFWLSFLSASFSSVCRKSLRNNIFRWSVKMSRMWRLNCLTFCPATCWRSQILVDPIWDRLKTDFCICRSRSKCCRDSLKELSESANIISCNT